MHKWTTHGQASQIGWHAPIRRPADRHAMRLVILRTGLTADLLRAWEKRYGAVTPMRSHGGQRLYSDADVERLWLQGVSETR